MTLPGNSLFRVSKEIGIDMGHRVTNHASKCRNMHGHRYRIIIECEGSLVETGISDPQEGMVIDFGFLKNLLMDQIDRVFDHGTCLWRQDPIVLATLSNEQLEWIDESLFKQEENYILWPAQHKFWGKIVISKYVPTAENLAMMWYNRIKGLVAEITEQRARLLKVTVWETPTSMAVYGE